MQTHSQATAPARKFHFISGLPRAGSTLLAAILRQNPRFRAGMTSPVADVIGVLVAELSSKNDFSAGISDEQRAAMLRGTVESFYSVDPGAEVVFDTSRLWCSRLPMLAALFPGSRVIACVRGIQWILDSMERLVREQPLNTSKVFKFNTNLTVYARAEALTDPKGMVGFSYQAVKDAFYSPFAPDRLLLLTYETLTRDPRGTMQAVYRFIDEPWFEHDFEHLDYRADEFDARVGLAGLHSIQPRVSAPERDSALPPELFNRFVNQSFWLDPKNNIHKVPII